MNIDTLHEIIDKINGSHLLNRYTSDELQDALIALMCGEAELADMHSTSFLIVTGSAIGVNVLSVKFFNACRDWNIGVTQLPQMDQKSAEILIDAGTRREKRFKFFCSNDLDAQNGLPIAKMFIDMRSINTIRTPVEVSYFTGILNNSCFFENVPKIVV